VENSEQREQLGFFAFILLVLVLSYFPIKQLIENYQPIRYVRVGGEFQYIKKIEIKAKISPLLNRGYFSIDLLAIQQAVMTLPWIDKVLVQRVWPNRLELKVYEQRPVVRRGRDALLNARAEVFKPVNIGNFKSLPMLITPEGLKKELLLTMQKMAQELALRNLELTKFKVNKRLSWDISLNNGIQVQLGRVAPLQKFMQLMNTLSVLGNKVSKIASIDMRYPNGYAVAWQKNEKINW